MGRSGVNIFSSRGFSFKLYGMIRTLTIKLIVKWKELVLKYSIHITQQDKGYYDPSWLSIQHILFSRSYQAYSYEGEGETTLAYLGWLH